MWRGSWFQTRTAATGKARSPTVDNRVRRKVSDDDELAVRLVGGLAATARLRNDSLENEWTDFVHCHLCTCMRARDNKIPVFAKSMRRVRILKWGHRSRAKVGEGYRSDAKRLKIVFGRAPPLFGSKSSISRFGERFRDGQYSLASLLFAVFLLTVLPLAQPFV